MRKKLTLERIRAIKRIIITEPSLFAKNRYLHFKIMSLECAQDYFDPQASYEDTMVNHQLYNQFRRKAEWYLKKYPLINNESLLK